MVVDVNGTAGYQGAGVNPDLVVRIQSASHIASFDIADFI
jgi:hypothetical protein